MPDFTPPLEPTVRVRNMVLYRHKSYKSKKFTPIWANLGFPVYVKPENSYAQPVSLYVSSSHISLWWQHTYTLTYEKDIYFTFKRCYIRMSYNKWKWSHYRLFVSPDDKRPLIAKLTVTPTIDSFLRMLFRRKPYGGNRQEITLYGYRWMILNGCR